MTIARRGVAVVTGASSGIGAATALRLASEGFSVVLGARRIDRLQEVARRCGGRALELDVTDPTSVEAFGAEVQGARVLVNNAGLASGLEPIAGIDEGRVEQMWATNVMGLLRVTRSLLPTIEASGDGHIVNVSSIAAFETYPGGAGYTASKHAARAITRTLRVELLGRPVRVTEIAPGHVDTEFALVRFDGDADKARATYEGFTPLAAEDVADCIAWAVTRPANVNIDEIVVRARAQANATTIARGSGEKEGGT
ncbi:MAG: SDR family NAD(P)-dependent oxidoreductase [Actinomycetota bacterium]